jgi:hypothetical protein
MARVLRRQSNATLIAACCVFRHFAEGHKVRVAHGQFPAISNLP